MQNSSILLPSGKNHSSAGDLSSTAHALDKILKKPQSIAAPSILLTATLRWPTAARLAIVFARMGCRVVAICPRQHPIAKIRAIRRIYPYSALKPLASLYAAIESAAPDLIIPCDDNAAVHLHRLHEYARVGGPSASAIAALIARSLGSPEACTLATCRGQLMALAAEEKVRVPETAVVASPSDLTAWFAQHSFPAVMKIDGTWGGQGVSIVDTHGEALRVFKRMASRPAVGAAIVRALWGRDPSFFLNSLKSARRTVTLQDFISGVPANRAVACWQGQVLAGISVEAIKTQHPTGPATVVRVIENAEMSIAVTRLVHRLGLSGLWGLDFVIEARTGAAYLIEMNPRATPICHLPLGVGQNLPAALYARIAGATALGSPAAIDHDVIALFPGEWHRNPASSYLRSDYHDIPWEEPGLIQDGIDSPWSERGLMARLWARMRSKSPRPLIRQQDPMDARIGVDGARDHLALNKFKYLALSARAGKRNTPVSSYKRAGAQHA